MTRLNLAMARTIIPRVGRAVAMPLACTLALAAASPAAAESADPLAELGSLRQTTVTATIASIDPATRHIVLTNGAGEHFTLKAPLQMRSFDQLQVGQKITATYAVETEFALSPPNAQLPADTETTLTARAARGELPGLLVANHIVVTGAIIGIDTATHTLKVVSPEGGEVHAIEVDTAAGREALSQLKVGDAVTAYVNEGLLIAVTPAA